MQAPLNKKLRLYLLSWRTEAIAVLCCTVIYQLFTHPKTLSQFAADSLGRVLMMLGVAVFAVVILWLWWRVSSRFFRFLLALPVKKLASHKNHKSAKR
ncbi:hypothetical protein ASC78_25025 [Variovorax sp. Root318D1]|jgi:hypothetical protein|uniref:hypothetical protein n=1 Tax=Variovorax sp. Root318D1 TaxID=1736513 RepID=UPI000701BFD2|nr:hypothetical protein [Variovorax sp. Root318D1]KQU88467.1 hypothetical protein ASC78_25025 [Variovorax sp. Root318D1]